MSVQPKYFPSVTKFQSFKPLVLKLLPALLIHFMQNWPGEIFLKKSILKCSIKPRNFDCRLASPRNEGGLGGQVNIALLSDLNHKICKEYGVLIEEGGHSLRGLFIIDDKGVLRHSSINDLQVGR